MLTEAPSCFYKLYSRTKVVHFTKEKICLNLLARLSVSALVRFAQHSDPMCACAGLSARPQGESALGVLMGGGFAHVSNTYTYI